MSYRLFDACMCAAVNIRTNDDFFFVEQPLFLLCVYEHSSIPFG